MREFSLFNDDMCLLFVVDCVCCMFCGLNELVWFCMKRGLCLFAEDSVAVPGIACGLKLDAYSRRRGRTATIKCRYCGYTDTIVCSSDGIFRHTCSLSNAIAPIQFQCCLMTHLSDPQRSIAIWILSDYCDPTFEICNVLCVSNI